MRKHLKAPSPAMAVALTALFMSLGGVGYAASQIGTNQIRNGAVTTHKLHNGAVTAKKLANNAVNGQKVQDNSLTGNDINVSTLGQVPDAAKLDGNGPASFVSSSISRHESPLETGTPLGDGTFYIDEACPPGDVLLNGGPANVAAGSTMVESFPTPNSTTSWRARIKPQAGGDQFSVVVLCAKQ
ncbi:MAG TPA: hypothetical protein VFN87_02775 [Solirubrobacteraceae bacterium]|nr:hypothetical protein [Solirubrobacteraceae bacterium]